MTPTTRLLTISGLLLTIGTGCAELEEFIPTVAFESLDVHDVNFQAVDVDFVFAVDNPNPIEVGLSSFSYDLGLGGENLLAGDNDDGFQLEASDASELRLPVNLAWLDAWNTVQAVRGEDQIGFALGGHFGFNTPLGEARLPYKENGDFPALRTPKFSLGKLRVANLDISNPLQPTARLELDVGVDNEHASTLFFDKFDYQVSLAGNNLGGGVVNTFDVDGATEGNVTLPLDINLISAGTAIYDVVTGGGQIDAGINATMDVDTPFGIVPLTIDEAGRVDVQAL